MDFEITGLEETAEMLEDAPRNLVASGFLRAFTAAGEVMASALEHATPVKAEDTGGYLDEGELRESVMMAIELDSQFRGGSVDVGFGKNGFIAYFLEYGHRAVGHKPFKPFLDKFVHADPFVRSVADTTAEASIDAFADSLGETVRSNYAQAPGEAA